MEKHGDVLDKSLTISEFDLVGTKSAFQMFDWDSDYFFQISKKRIEKR